MNNQLSRIASFIDSLGDDNVLGNESSFLLSTDMNAIGGNNEILDIFEYCFCNDNN